MDSSGQPEPVFPIAERNPKGDFRCMKTSLVLDDDLQTMVVETARRVGEKEATVIRMALRLGLPIVQDRFSDSPREHFPEGSLARFFTRKRNAEELELLRGASLEVDHE
jgi:hypothetical protein